MSLLDTIFKAYDIRGTVPDQLNADLARAIGAAFARFTRRPTVLVARDMRQSGVELSRAFAEGVTASGVDVVDLGLASTDELYFASGPRRAGRHVHRLPQPGPVQRDQAVPGRRPAGRRRTPGWPRSRPRSRPSSRPAPRSTGPTPADRLGDHADVLEDYAAHVRSFVDTAVLRPLKVVADTANGMGGLVVPAVFAACPSTSRSSSASWTARSPTIRPTPSRPANLVDLQARVLETGADVGLAFDGDADRCFLVDDRASRSRARRRPRSWPRPCSAKHPGATILYNLICSKAVPEIIREQGGVPIRTRVGHSFIKAVMADTGAVFGGEHSAHYYFRDNYRADSGSSPPWWCSRCCPRPASPLSELRKPLRALRRLRRDQHRGRRPGRGDRAVAAAYGRRPPEATQDRTDGLTVDLGDWWFNLRPSNTEPLLRLNLEAANARRRARPAPPRSSPSSKEP